MKAFYTYAGSDEFYIHNVVLAEPGDVLVVDNNNIANISKTNRELDNCPEEVLLELLSKCTIISTD